MLYKKRYLQFRRINYLTSHHYPITCTGCIIEVYRCPYKDDCTYIPGNNGPYKEDRHYKYVL